MSIYKSKGELTIQLDLYRKNRYQKRGVLRIMEKEEAVKILQEARTIFITFEDWGYSKAFRAKFPYFMIWVFSQEFDRLVPIMVEDSVYFDKKKYAYGLNIYGSDRVFELLYSIDKKTTDELYKKVQRLWV